MASQVPIPKSDPAPAQAPLARASEIGTGGYVDESGKSKLFRKLKQEPAVPIGECCWSVRLAGASRRRQPDACKGGVAGCGDKVCLGAQRAHKTVASVGCAAKRPRLWAW